MVNVATTVASPLNSRKNSEVLKIMCTIARNEQFNSYEITFDGKPAEAVRDLLKANGYRWHKMRGIWYGYKDIADQLNGAEIGATAPIEQAQKTEQNADRQAQKALIEQYAKLYGGDNIKSVDYMRGAVAYVVELEDGKLYAIDNPRIQTRFCFGYGQNGISTQEDYNDACDRMHNADTNENYFIRENLKPLLFALKEFETETITSEDDYYLQRYRYKKPYIFGNHYGAGTEKMAYVEFIDNYGIPTAEQKAEIEKAITKGARPATDNEIKQIIAAHKIVIEQFKKRLAAYLKRYGLSKLDTWIYLSD